MAHRYSSLPIRLILGASLATACAPHRMYPARSARSDHRWVDAAVEFNEMLRKQADGEVNLGGNEVQEAIAGRAEARREGALEAVTHAEAEPTPDKRFDRAYSEFTRLRRAYAVQEIEVQLYPRMEQWATDCEAEPTCPKRSPLPARVTKLKDVRTWLRSNAVRTVVAAEGGGGGAIRWANLERTATADAARPLAEMTPLAESAFLSFAEKKTK